MRDISTAKRRFQELTVYLDTSCVLGAIGLEGKRIEIAAREGVELLKNSGARIAVFDATLHEIKSILSVYENRIGTQEGRESLHTTALTRHLITNRYTPAMVKQAKALLEMNVKQLGISIRTFPKRQKRFTLDEAALARSLARPEEPDDTPRIVHDVDSVAAILTLRQGRQVRSLDRGKAVFCTNQGQVVRTVERWFREQGQEGPPPIIHQVRLTNLAWVKKPAAAPTLKVHELSALCWAALKPSADTWRRFLAHLRNLRDEQQLTSDEAVAMVVSEFTDVYLGELEDREDELEADSLSEVVERVRRTYRQEADQQVTAAEERARLDAEDKRQLELRVRSKLSLVAQRISLALFCVGMGVVFIGLGLLLPGALGALASSVEGAWGAWGYRLGWLVIVLLVVLTFLNLTRGVHLLGLREQLRRRLVVAMEGWFLDT